MFQNADKNNTKYHKIMPSLKVTEVTAFAFPYRIFFSVWSIINEECVLFSGLVKGKYCT